VIKKGIYNGAAFFLIPIFLLLPGCGNDKDRVQTATSNKKDSVSRLSKNFYADCKALLTNARRMDSVLLNETEADAAKGNEAIAAFTDFAYYCKSDSMSPVYLIKTAQVARAVKNIPQAKTALDHCIAEYPSFSNRPAALFLLAQLYEEDNYMNDPQEARRLYQQIIDDYPKSEWAASARGALRFVGKSDQEIMNELKKKNKKP
jgi:TolA-binding protein